MRITEIYKSIQGESTYAGLPCVFVRTTGCNLRCVWCDTEYAFYGGTNVTLDEVVSQVERLDCNLVEITGGEPLLQRDVPELAKRLLEDGHTVLIETSGERDISVLDPRVVKIMDLKCPGSGECEKNRWQNLEFLSRHDEVKFVIFDRNDYEWAADVVRRYELERRAHVLFSPVFGQLELAEMAKWILEDGLFVRFQIQLHKVIWEPDARSV